MFSWTMTSISIEQFQTFAEIMELYRKRAHSEKKKQIKAVSSQMYALHKYFTPNKIENYFFQNLSSFKQIA